MTMSRTLLVSPSFDLESALTRKRLRNSVQDDVPDSVMVPLHLATVAALTPEEFEVDIWDEGARGEITDETDFGKNYDLVGVTGYNAHLPRAIQLAQIRQGVFAEAATDQQRVRSATGVQYATHHRPRQGRRADSVRRGCSYPGHDGQ